MEEKLRGCFENYYFSSGGFRGVYFFIIILDVGRFLDFEVWGCRFCFFRVYGVFFRVLGELGICFFVLRVIFIIFLFFEIELKRYI